MLKEIRMEKLEYTENAMEIKWTTFGNRCTQGSLNFTKAVKCASSSRNYCMKDKHF
jgi:hypothetical protein